MKASTRLLVAGLMSWLLALTSMIGQNPSSNSNSPLVSFADSLRARGIEVSEPSLIAALRNGDPEIRALAALKLAEDRDLDAVPFIENALSIERSPNARIDIAGALQSLNDSKGLAHLQAMCSDASLPIDVIVHVVQNLNITGESSAPCADPVLNFLDSHTDSESRMRFQSALPDLYPWVSHNQADRVVRLLQNMLADQDPSVRMEASHALVRIGSRSSADALRSALLTEKDPLRRSRLQNDLSILESKQ